MNKEILQDERVLACQSEVEELLGDEGRTLLRPSGTEPLIRVMVEALDPDKCTQAIDRLTSCLTAVNADY